MCVVEIVDVSYLTPAVQSFVDSGNNGLDGVIPRPVLEAAKGFAILTIFKAGFLLSARAGSGVVIAKLDDGSKYAITRRYILNRLGSMVGA